MAITESTRIETAIKTGFSNTPSLGCGGVNCRAGDPLNAHSKGPFAAIQLCSSATLVLTSIVWAPGGGITDAVTGAPVTSITLDSRVFNTWYLPIVSASSSGADFIAYHRCK